MSNIAYHFTGATLRDGSPIPPIGHKLIYPGKIEICRAGYHWSRQPFDALQYAPGALLHKVEYGGEVIERDDKGVSSERTILATIDATHLLRRFAADQALSVAHCWEMPDVVRAYLTTLDEDKRADAAAAAWVADAARHGGRAVSARLAAMAATPAAAAMVVAARPAAAVRAVSARTAGVAAWAWVAARAAWVADAAWVAADAARAAARDDFNTRVEAAFAGAAS